MQQYKYILSLRMVYKLLLFCLILEDYDEYIHDFTYIPISNIIVFRCSHITALIE